MAAGHDIEEAARLTLDGSAARCRLRIGFPVRKAAATDLLERGGEELPVAPDGEGGSIVDIDFRAFQIRTVRLSRPRP